HGASMTAKNGAVPLLSRASLLKRLSSNPISQYFSHELLITQREYKNITALYRAKDVTHINRWQPAQARLAGRAGNPLVALEAGGGRADRGQAGRAAPGIARTAVGRHRYHQ